MDDFSARARATRYEEAANTCAIVAVIAVIVLLLGMGFWSYCYTQTMGMSQATGIVTDKKSESRRTSSSGKRHVSRKILITIEVDGKEYSAWKHASLLGPNKGEKVSVYYDDLNPNKMQLKSDLFYTPIVIVSASALTAVVSFGLRIKYKQNMYRY